jgi:hypothetical protein
VRKLVDIKGEKRRQAIERLSFGYLLDSGSYNL